MFSGRSIREVGWSQRLTAPVVRRFAAWAARTTLGRDLNRLRATRRLPPTTIEDLLRDRTILVNSVFGVEYPRPLPRSVHMVGPMMLPDTAPMPDDLARWLDDGPPVVYANLGTLATASDAQLAALLSALSDRRYRVLWILKDAQAARLPHPPPPSVRVTAWGPPPVSILQHPNVRAFLSHCGTNSVHEAIVAGTPIVGIPMFADQLDWGVRISDAGIGMWLDKMRFGAEDVRAAIVRVLTDEAFRLRMPIVQRAVAEAGGVARAADLIEREAAVMMGAIA
jgi:MGT family glycosyltransferase